MTKLRSESGKRLIRLVISLAMTEGLSALKSRSRINYKLQDSLVLFGKRLSVFCRPNGCRDGQNLLQLIASARRRYFAYDSTKSAN